MHQPVKEMQMQFFFWNNGKEPSLFVSEKEP